MLGNIGKASSLATEQLFLCLMAHVGEFSQIHDMVIELQRVRNKFSNTLIFGDRSFWNLFS